MTHPAKIECLIFDFFGVLVAFDEGLVYDRIAQHCANPAEAARQMANLVSEPSLVRGRTSLRQAHGQLVSSLGLRVSYDDFERLWLVSYSEPMPGMRDLLRQMSRQCRLVLLSNVDGYYWSTARACVPELDGFHAEVLSFAEGVAKPEAMAFHRAVAAGGVGVERCYFVDDKSENIEAAAATGLAGHLFKNCHSLKAALRELGLPVE